jgi:diacylglycerol kinase family enzyme
MNNEPSRFNRVVVLRNPVSTQAAPARQRITELRRIFGKELVTVVDTSPDGIDANRQLLRAHAKLLGPQTLLCIAAGDGTVNMVIETLVQDTHLSAQARKTPVLPLWGGNANDLAHMLNGMAYRGRLREALYKGKVIAVHPLACALRSQDGAKRIRTAACYATFGATAYAAEQLNDTKLRSSWLHRVPGMRLSLFAKVERLPLRLTEPVFLSHTLEEKRLKTVVPHLARAMRKRLSPRFRDHYAEFTIEESILAQFDGEPMEIQAGTTVSMAISERPFYALSLLLGNDD